ncbi:hypothetical protein BH11MYX3_BH11MYX3_29950 [soil metagenome]
MIRITRRPGGAACVLALALGCRERARSNVSASPTGEGAGAALITEASGRAAHTATTLGSGEVFVAGGCVTDGCSTASAETFIVAADGRSINRGPALAEARDAHTATQVEGGLVVLTGGFAAEGTAPLASVEVFDERARTVSTRAQLATGRGGHIAEAIGPKRILVVGGWIGPRRYTASSEIVDLESGEVRGAPPLPIAVDGHDSARLRDGRVLVTGGQTRPGLGSARAFLFDPAAMTWSEVASMQTPRFKHTSVVLANGEVLVIGGTPDDRERLLTTEVFSPSTNTFRPGPRLSEPRYKLRGGAALTADGRVIIGGGGRTVEILDVDSGTSRVMAEASVRGSFATVSILDGGKALFVLGGYDDKIALRRTSIRVAL